MVIGKRDMNDWLDEPLDNMPRCTREAIGQELEGRLGTLWDEAESDFERWCVRYIAENWDLVLDMLTMMAMNGVYGRNQEENIAMHLTVKCFADGSLCTGGFGDMGTEVVYYRFDTLLSRCRTYVSPWKVCP